MAINKVEYAGRILMDLTDSTVTPETLAKDAIAYAANGEKIIGTMEAGGGLPNGIAGVYVGTYTPASEVTGAARIPHNLGEIPDFFVMYAEGTFTAADFPSYICAVASVPLSIGSGIGVRIFRYGTPNGNSFSTSATSYYEGNYTTTTFSVVQSSSYKLKAGTIYKFVVGKFA